MPEVNLIVNGVTLGSVLVILGLLLKQHKVWVRMKDRVNALWYKHCSDAGERFESLDNGR